MLRPPPFTLIYDGEIPHQLRVIERKYHSLIRSTIEEQLVYEPEVAATNRKPLTRPVLWEARWELRFGPHNRFRVYYRVYGDEREVHILAIDVKVRNKIYIAGEEYDL